MPRMMRRAAMTAAALLLVCSGVFAQSATPIPLDPLTPTPAPARPAVSAQTSADDAAAYAATAQSAAAQASETAATVDSQTDLAFNLFGLFEVITGFFALVIPLGAIALGVFGWSQIRRARDQGAENRAMLERQLDDAVQRIEAQVERSTLDTDQRLADAAASQKLAEGRMQDELRNWIERERRGQQEALDAARAEFNASMQQRGEELVALNAEIARSADQQRLRLEQAALAGSLLPLGERQYRAGDLDGARDTYLRALALDETNPVAHYKLGYVYVHADELEAAEQHLQRALALEPGFAPAQAALGFAYRRMAERLERRLSDDRTLSDEARAQGQLEIGALYSRAETQLVSALRQSPRLVDEDNESWYGSLGGLYRRRGQFDQAISAYHMAAVVTPYSSYPFINLAVMHLQDNNRESMLAMFSAAERLARGETIGHPDNYYGYADLLTAQLALGKAQAAAETLQVVIDIAPSASALGSLRDTLVRLRQALSVEPAAVVERVMARLDEAIQTHGRSALRQDED